MYHKAEIESAAHKIAMINNISLDVIPLVCTIRPSPNMQLAEAMIPATRQPNGMKHAKPSHTSFYRHFIHPDQVYNTSMAFGLGMSTHVAQMQSLSGTDAWIHIKV